MIMETKEIIEIIKNASGVKHLRIKNTLCVVRNVDLTGQTCDVEPLKATDFDINTPNSSNYITDVQLSANQLGINNYVIYPIVGSIVIISWLTDHQSYISSYDTIDQIDINIGGYDYNISNSGLSIKLGDYSYILNDSGLTFTLNSQTLTADTNGFKFNGGNNDGMVLLQGLLTKINRLEDILKSHKHAYIPYPGGSASTPVLTTPASAATPPDNTLVFTDTVQADLENIKIKQ